MKHQTFLGISDTAYLLPRKKITLNDKAVHRLLHSSPALLKKFGFQNCYQATQKESETLSVKVGKKLIQNHHRIKYVCFYSGVESSVSEDLASPLSIFQYRSHKLAQDLNLGYANTMAFSEQGCSGMLNMIHMMKHVLEHEEFGTECLCIAVDVLPKDSQREIMYNLMSDATSALIVSNNSTKNQIVAFHQINQSYYWNTPLREQELLAAYFPMTIRTIQACLQKAHLILDEIDWIVPHNVSLRSWQILCEMMNIPLSKVWTNNITRIGHTVSADHIINLTDMQNSNVLKKGNNLLLFTFGFGANWSCMILKH